MTTTQTPSYTFYPALDQLLAGVGAGTISTICMQPLDLVKTRFQLDNSITGEKNRIGKNFGRTLRTMKAIVANEGGPKALYKGMSPNIAGNAASWGLYFMWYSMIKSALNPTLDTEVTQKLTALQYLSASALASAITAVCTNPLWVVKTRMMASMHSTSTVQTPKFAYRGLLDALWTIGRQEGIGGLYRGMLPSLFGVSHGALQWMAYEKLKSWRRDVHGQTSASQEQLSNFEYITLSTSSKLFATVMTYPYQVVRARIQIVGASGSPQPYSSVRDVIAKTFNSEGISGFYKGLAPNTFRVLPGTIITFLCYENISAWFRRHAI